MRRAPWIAALLVLLAPRAARACAVCATADPTLSVPGTEQPYRGRLRLYGDVRAGHVDVGDARLDDRRFELATVWAPRRELELGLVLPFLVRRLTTPTERADRAVMGDVELRAQLLAWEARGAFGRRRFGLFATLKLPTAPLERDARGEPLPSTLQPGCGALGPSLGAYYATGRGPWSFYTTIDLLLPLQVRAGPHAGESLRSAAQIQLQPTHHLGGRAGLVARVDSNAELASGAVDPNAGGFVGYVSTELVASPVTDLVLTLGALFPVAQALQGRHREGAVVSATVAYDF